MEPSVEPPVTSPGEPPPELLRAPRRRWPWVLAALAVVLALITGATVTWWVTDQLGRAPDNDKPTSAASAERTPANDAAALRRDAATVLLAARSKAILARDKGAFLALIDPAARQFKTQQAIVFDRLAKVPFAAWEYEFQGDGPPLGGDHAAQLPKGAFIADVLLRYTFDGTETPVERVELLTLVPRGGDWLIASDRYTGPDARDANLGRDIWELGPVTVVEGRRSLVIGEAKASVLRSYAREADQSVRDVGKVWKTKWTRRPVVIVPRTQADMAQVVGMSRRGLAQIAAVTTGYSMSGPTHGDRVVINPAAWRDLEDDGRRVVMTHEVTHLATRAVTYTEVPIWMSEGFADYVAYQAIDVPVSLIAEDLLDQVRKSKGPTELPGDRDFDASQGDIATAYEGSWLAAKLIADRYGERKLIRLYIALADRDNNPAKDIRAVLGISERKLVTSWRAYMKNLADE